MKDIIKFKPIALSIISALVLSPIAPLTVLAAPSDSVNPVASISAPANNSTVSGTVNITANASDAFSNCVVRIFGQSYDVSVLGSTHSGGNVFNCGTNMDAVYAAQHGTNVNRIAPYLIPTSYVGVTKVEFYVDGTLQSTDTASPYAFNWNSAGVTNGAHTIQVKAYDGSRIGSSAIINIIVNNAGQTPPPPPTTPPTTTTTPSPTSTPRQHHDDDDDEDDDEEREERQERKNKEKIKNQKRLEIRNLIKAKRLELKRLIEMLRQGDDD